MNPTIDYILDIVFTTFEFSAVYVLIFILFKLSLEKQGIMIVCSSFLASTVSTTFQAFGYTFTSIIFQILLIFIMLRYMTHLHYFYAFVCTMVGYFFYGFFNVPLAMVFLKLSGMNVVEYNRSYAMFVMQFIAAILAFATAYVIRRRWMGFDYIPDHGKFHHSKNQVWITVLITTVILLFLVLITLVFLHLDSILLWGVSFLLISLITLIYAIHNDRKHALSKGFNYVIKKKDKS